MLPLLMLLVMTVIYDVTTAGTCSRVATFNTALAHGISDYTTRLGEMTEALGELDADVICLQEVWLESDMQTILDALGDKFPHHYSSIHYSKGVLRKSTCDMGRLEAIQFFNTIFSPCSHTDIAKVNASVYPCAYTQGCFSVYEASNTKLAALQSLYCITQQCRPQLMDLQASCVACIVLMAGEPGNLHEVCTPRVEVVNDMNPSGLLLLSKSPITRVKYREFFPGHRMIFTRAFIKAQVKGLRKVVCTHLTSTSSPLYYEYDMPNFESFKSEQREEIRQLLERFGSKRHLLVGDLNTGPEVVNQEDGERNLTGWGQDHFQMLIDAGYSTDYLASDGRCTYCSHNPLTDSYNKAIDFVLSKNQDSLELKNSSRVMDQVSPWPLSDHFGVVTYVCPRLN